MKKRKNGYKCGCDYYGIAYGENGKLYEYNTWYPEKLLEQYNCFAIFNNEIAALLYIETYAKTHNLTYDPKIKEV